MATAADSLPASVQAALKRFSLDGSGLSVFVQSLDDSEPLLSYRDTTPRNPASTVKLFTTMAALDILTPSYQWSTNIHARGQFEAGILHGDLWMVGGGDPFLPIERMWLMVDRLRSTGLNSIRGDLYIDQSLFEPLFEDPAAFDGQGLRSYNVVPAALVSNFNTTLFLFKPGPTAGDVQVQLIPDLKGLEISNRLRTVNRACRGYNRGIAITVDTRGVVNLDGRFPARCEIYGMSRSVMQRDDYTAELFRRLWTQSGGTWQGQVRSGVGEFELEPMLRFESLFLGEVVRSINKYSNNLMTRMLFLTLGMEQHGAPGNTLKARQALLEWLASKQIDSEGLFIDNGAGSSRNTRVSARQMGALLAAAWRSRYMPEFLGSMAISGQDGTFSKRHVTGPLNGSAHLKTGRLDHVSAMAGYLQAQDGRRYAVVSLHNATDAHRGSGHAVQDALLKWLYHYQPAAHAQH